MIFQPVVEFICILHATFHFHSGGRAAIRQQAVAAAVGAGNAQINNIDGDCSHMAAPFDTYDFCSILSLSISLCQVVVEIEKSYKNFVLSVDKK